MSFLNIDALSRTITVDRDELKNHQVYLRVKEKIDNGYHLVVRDPPRPGRPYYAVTLTRAQARNTTTYEAAKAEAQKLGKPLWIED